MQLPAFTIRLTTFCCTVVALLACGAAADRPNVLFIAVDDLNNRLGCYGRHDVQTPALDALAAEGMVFQRAYCQYPVCNPSRSSFMTGLRPETTTVLDNRTDLRQIKPELVTLPQCFKEQGYWTAAAGKVYHGKFDHGQRSWHQYRVFDNVENPVIKRARLQFEAEHGSIDKPANRRAWRQRLKEIRPQAGGQTPAGFGPTDLSDDEHRDGRNVRQIVQWLESRAYGDKPFFIACGVHKPHVPFWAPQKYFDLYPSEKIVFLRDPADDWDDIPQRALSGRYKTFGVPAGDDAKRRQVTAAYHACVTFIDAQMRYLLDGLKRLELWDDTIVVFFSDHGYHLGEHGMWGKVTLFEESARVPLIVRVPGGAKPGSQTAALVELVDLYPTLAELCGIEPPENLEGLSFVPLLANPDRPWKQAAFTIVTRGADSIGRSLRTPRWRYAEWGDPQQNELYDLAADPRELTNLAARSDHRETVLRLRALLQGGWQQALPQP